MASAHYFSDLNYSLSNEDTLIEYELIPEGAQTLFCIAGSGARCLPLLAKNPSVLDIVDMSLPQLFLTELRVEACRSLSYEDFLFFMGYREFNFFQSKDSIHRLELFKNLNLSLNCRNYWLQNSDIWSQNGFIFLGRWEKHFNKIGVIFRDILKCDVSCIFEAQSIEEQILIYNKLWPTWRWNSFLRIFASEFVFNRFLYKGHFSGRKETRTESKAPYQFIREEFHRIFTTQLVRKNYFMQVLFLGKIKYEEGLPFEANKNIYNLAQKSKTKINYINLDLNQALQSKRYDFISLSDTISYLSQHDIASLMVQLPKQSNQGCRVVMRSFLRAPEFQLPLDFESKSDWEMNAKEIDGTAVYNFHIFERIQLTI